MHYAAIGRTGKLIEADHAHVRRDYTCPTCHGRVFLRDGRYREAHFAHYAGEGTPECENYHPGAPSSTPPTTQPRVRVEVEDDTNSLGLVVTQTGNDWTLLLRLPELLTEELRDSGLATLRSGFIDVFAGTTAIGRVSGLDVRPGVGVARVPVPPSLQAYHTHASGIWSASVQTNRWTATASPLTARGCLFRLRTGEWVRLREGSVVQSGEILLLVADDRCAPPTATNADRANAVGAQGLRWRLWRIQIAKSPSDNVRRWLDELGYRLAPQSWGLSVLSVPVAFVESEPVFRHEEPLIIRLTAPEPNSFSTLALTQNANRHSVTVTANKSQELYMSISAASQSIARIDVADESISTTTVRFASDDSGGLTSVPETLAAVPRLGVSIGDCRVEAWANRIPRFSRNGSVDVSAGIDGIRVDVTVYIAGNRRISSSLSLRAAKALIEESLDEAEAIELDGGNFGRVRIDFLETQSEAFPVSPERLAGWLRAMSADLPQGRAWIAVTPNARALRVPSGYVDPTVMTQLRVMAKRQASRRNRVR